MHSPTSANGKQCTAASTRQTTTGSPSTGPSPPPASKPTNSPGPAPTNGKPRSTAPSASDETAGSPHPQRRRPVGRHDSAQEFHPPLRPPTRFERYRCWQCHFSSAPGVTVRTVPPPRRHDSRHKTDRPHRSVATHDRDKTPGASAHTLTENRRAQMWAAATTTLDRTGILNV